MNKYKIKVSDNKYYVVYSESRENAVKKLRDAYINKNSKITDYQPKEISHSRLEAIPLQARQELQNSKNKGATLLSIEGNIEDIINAAEPSNREELKQMGSKITNDLRRQFRITDNVDRNKIEQVIKSRQFELRRDGDKIQEYIYKGNSEDKKNAFEELAKVLPANVGLGLSGDVLSVSFRDNTIKDDNISEFKKELAKWQDLYINKKLITSSELSEKAKELRQKYNIKDEKLTSESILEKAKSLGGQAKQNGATGVLGISITSPQRSDEFADWLEKNNIHYNSDGRQYYVEIQDCEIEDKLIQSGSEEAFKKNIATEIRAGKDPKQAAAIAYSVQRENDNTIKDSIAKVENIGKFTLWQDEDTKEYYFDATISRSGKKLHPLGTKDINKAREKVKKELEWITDSAIEDSYYTESEKKDKQFVKNAIEEMEGYINNWNFLTARQKRDIGSSREQLKARVAELKQVKDSSIKDAYDYIGNAMVFKSLPKIGEKAQKYGFGYSNSVISKIEKTYNKDGYQFYIVYCMDEEDYKNNHGTQYYYSVAIKDSNIVRDYSTEDAEELPHITKEQWNKIPNDYKTIDPATGKKQAFAGSLGIAPGGTTLLTEGKHFIIDTGIEDSLYNIKDSIMQEYEEFKSRLGKEKAKSLDKYLNTHNNISYSDILYKKAEYDKFENWYSKGMKDNAINDNKYKIVNYNNKWFYETKWGDGHTSLTGPYTSREEAEAYFHKHLPTEKLDSAIKDSSDYTINYRNSYTGERNKETIKANSAIEAIKRFADAVALRGLGTRNIDIISISPNDGYVRLYGSLQALLASKEFRDCNTVVNDSEPKNWTYVMFGTTGEKKVENLTKAEAEHLLKNNKLLGYSGKIYETVRDNTNNTNKILDSDIVVARSLDELISKIKSWDGETTTNYILSPKSSGWYFDYFITMGHKYSYYAYIKKTAHGRHDNPNVDISKQNIDKTVTAKTAQELIDQVVIILK